MPVAERVIGSDRLKIEPIKSCGGKKHIYLLILCHPHQHSGRDLAPLAVKRQHILTREKERERE